MDGRQTRVKGPGYSGREPCRGALGPSDTADAAEGPRSLRRAPHRFVGCARGGLRPLPLRSVALKSDVNW